MSYLLNAAYRVFASGLRTETEVSDEFQNRQHKGVIVSIVVSNDGAATPSVVYTIEGKDEESGNWYTILASAAITAAGTTVLRVYPGIAAAANSKADDILPLHWRVTATHADTDEITYSVGAVLVP